MLNTPLTQLRKNAAGSITAQKVVDLLRRRGMKRAVSTITAFERGQFAETDEQFIRLYAEAIDATVEEVLAALKKTQRLRKRAAGPFVVRSPRRRAA